MLLSLPWPLIFVLVSAWYWHQGGSPYGVLFCVAWGLWTLLAPPWRVRLRDDAVAVDWLGWSRKIPFALYRALDEAWRRAGSTAQVGAPKWPPHPQRSARPGQPVTRLDLARLDLARIRASGRWRGARAWSAGRRRRRGRAARPSAGAAARAA